MDAVTCPNLLREARNLSRSEYERQEDGVCVARLLLERGADVNKQRRNDHCMALHRRRSTPHSFFSNMVRAQTRRLARELHPCTRFCWAHTDPEKMVFVLDGYYWSGRECQGQVRPPRDSATRNQRFELAQLLPKNAVIFHRDYGQARNYISMELLHMRYHILHGRFAMSYR
ncbi:hypothetical protein EDB83DRAFT_1639654 [Lactarius deliciosus]|nr:hypothetical protein EDB83DRAFT_1639654 [Lactarius deliciosus]